MYIISSGNIAPGVTYQVLVDSITYNGTTYSAGSYFVGVDGVTDYTGSGEVYEASLINNISVGFEEPALFYSPNDLFTDESKIFNISACIAPKYFNAKLKRDGAITNEETIEVIKTYF